MRTNTQEKSGGSRDLWARTVQGEYYSPPYGSLNPRWGNARRTDLLKTVRQDQHPAAVPRIRSGRICTQGAEHACHRDIHGKVVAYIHDPTLSSAGLTAIEPLISCAKRAWAGTVYKRWENCLHLCERCTRSPCVFLRRR